MLAVFREEYSAYEDLGAMLDALLTNRQDQRVPLLERLISYGVGQVELAKVMQRFEINTSHQLYEKLGLGDLIPAKWRQEFPDLDPEKALRTAANFFFEDCVRNQKKDGLRAFNKLKHGLLVVPNATRYLPNLVDARAALFKTDESRPEAAVDPFSLYAVPMTDERLEGRLRSINFIQANLRMIAVLRVIARHPDVIKRRGVMNPLEVLRTPYLVDLINFIEQVTRLGNSDANHSKFGALQQLLSRMRRWGGLEAYKIRALKCR